MKELSIQQFLSDYKPVKNHLNPKADFMGFGFEPHGPERDCARMQEEGHVWSVVINAIGGLSLVPFYTEANIYAYMVTEMPCINQDIEVIWADPKPMAGTPITIYTTSEFMGNLVRYEGSYVSHGQRPYAQYKNAPYIQFKPKGKRKVAEIIRCYNPFILVLEGHGHPEPDGLYSKDEARKNNTDGTRVLEANHMSFSSKWREDFNSLIEPTLAKATIIADFRASSGFTVKERQYA